MNSIIKCKLRLDFPTTPDPSTDASVREHLRWASEYLVRYFGEEHIHAIVLAGSLAIGEGSAFVDGNEKTMLLSDIDLVVIAKDGLIDDCASLSAMKRELNISINSDRPSELMTPIDTGIMTVEELRSWWQRPLIVTLQLAGTARVLWGDDAVLPSISPASAKEICDADIFKLFNNRMAEQVFYLDGYSNGRENAKSAVFHSAKASVDTVLAMCAAARECPPGLTDRLDVFKEICHDETLGPEMADWAEFWTRYKLSPKRETVLSHNGAGCIEEAVLGSWDEAANGLLKGLLWSAKKRLDFRDNSIERLITHLAKRFGFSHQQNDKARRDRFIDILRHSNLELPSLERIEYLVSAGSPKSLVYGSAALLLAASREKGKNKERILHLASKMLPTVEPIYQADVNHWWTELLSETAALWNAIIMDGTR